MATSTLYHACDQFQTQKYYCIAPYDTLQFADFLAATVAVSIIRYFTKQVNDRPGFESKSSYSFKGTLRSCDFQKKSKNSKKNNKNQKSKFLIFQFFLFFGFFDFSFFF